MWADEGICVTADCRDAWSKAAIVLTLRTVASHRYDYAACPTCRGLPIIPYPEYQRSVRAPRNVPHEVTMCLNGPKTRGHHAERILMCASRARGGRVKRKFGEAKPLWIKGLAGLH
jgi:hypothetical protein